VLGDGSGGKMTLPFIDLQDVHKAYNVRRGVFRAGKLLHAVSGVSFSVPEGSTFGLVGESGSGKSTIARMVLGAEAATSGEVRVAGQNVTTLDRKQRFQLRRTLQPVLQDPYSSLNPRIRIAAIVDEPLRVHRIEHGQSLKARVAQLLEQVGLSAETMRRYPNELSGGQRQRVAIARAISINPRCLVLDEPVSALDVSIQAQILNLLKDLQARLRLTYLLISHDLAVVSYMSDQIGVLYLGQFMEIASREDIIANARHPYTQALMAAADSTIGEEVGRVGNAVQGEIPSPLSPPSGCPFHPRCPMAEARCRQEKPALRAFGPSHQVACHLAESTR